MGGSKPNCIGLKQAIEEIHVLVRKADSKTGQERNAYEHLLKPLREQRYNCEQKMLSKIKRVNRAEKGLRDDDDRETHKQPRIDTLGLFSGHMEFRRKNGMSMGG